MFHFIVYVAAFGDSWNHNMNSNYDVKLTH